MPKVSICIPTYNQTKYLRKTLDSIAIQTYQDFEIIITDDTPSSLVMDLIEEYDFDNKIRYFKNVSPLGSPQNWNFCIGKAYGEFIKIMHHDDWFTYDYSLAEFVKLLDADSTINFAFSSSYVLFETGENWNHSISIEQMHEIQSNPALLITGNTIGGPSATIFRKGINECFDQKLKWLVDIDFYMAILNKSKRIGHIPDSLITTFAAVGRISDFCINNKKIEVSEYFYLYQKIKSFCPKPNKSTLCECLKFLLNICDKYKINSVSDIRACGYNGEISRLTSLYIFIKNNFSNLRLQYYSRSLISSIILNKLSK